MLSNIDSEFSNLFATTVDITNEYNRLNDEINAYLERMPSDKETLDNLMQDLNTINSKLNTNIIFTYIENLIEQSDLPDEDTVDRLLFVKKFQIKESVKEKLINKKILLIDDVFASGFTLKEAIKLLKENNIKNIECIVFCYRNHIFL